MSLTTYIKDSGTYKVLLATYAKVSGNWKLVWPRFKYNGNWSHTFMWTNVQLTGLTVNGVDVLAASVLPGVGDCYRVEVAHGASVVITAAAVVNTLAKHYQPGHASALIAYGGGDPDCDGVCTYYDHGLVLKLALGLDILQYGYLDTQSRPRAKVNEDAIIDMVDSLIVLNALATNTTALVVAVNGTNTYTFTVNDDHRYYAT
jgi:hypothetical protein